MLEPIVKNVMMRKWRRPRFRPKGFVTKEVAVTLAALQGRHIQITVDRVLRARVKMMKNKANRARRLFGDGDAAVFADGDRVRGGVLVREAVQ